MTRIPASWLEVERTPEPDLGAYISDYAHGALQTAGRFGFHIVINEPRCGRWLFDASIVAGRPTDPRWDDAATGFVVVTAPSAAMRTLLLTAAWRQAAALGYRQLAGCTGRHRSRVQDCAQRLDDLRPCTLLTPVPDTGVDTGGPRPGYRLTPDLWAQRLPRPNPGITTT